MKSSLFALWEYQWPFASNCQPLSYLHPF